MNTTTLLNVKLYDSFVHTIENSKCSFNINYFENYIARTKNIFNFYNNKSESDKFNDILSLHSLLPEFDNIYQFFDDIVYLYNKNLYINYISKNNFDLIHLLRTICE